MWKSQFELKEWNGEDEGNSKEQARITVMIDLSHHNYFSLSFRFLNWLVFLSLSDI